MKKLIIILVGIGILFGWLTTPGLKCGIDLGLVKVSICIVNPIIPLKELWSFLNPRLEYL